jgi:hypothetical protein
LPIISGFEEKENRFDITGRDRGLTVKRKAAGSGKTDERKQGKTGKTDILPKVRKRVDRRRKLI